MKKVVILRNDAYIDELEFMKDECGMRCHAEVAIIISKWE